MEPCWDGKTDRLCNPDKRNAQKQSFWRTRNIRFLSVTKAWSGKDVKEYKEFKGLKKENLRDNMTNLELVLNMLAEATTKEFSQKDDPTTFEQSKNIANRGGTVAGNARKDIENQLGEEVVTRKNAKEIHFQEKKKIK